MNFKKSDKQRLINEYAAETGRNTLDVAHIREWLKQKPDHEFYDYVFGASDDKKIEEYEKDRIAGLIRGLRITVKHETVKDVKVRIKVADYPAYISPMKDRKHGGGYVPFDPSSEVSQQELRLQAAQALAAWLARYRGCVEHVGHDVTPMEQLVHALRGIDDEDAA